MGSRFSGQVSIPGKPFPFFLRDLLLQDLLQKIDRPGIAGVGQDAVGDVAGEVFAHPLHRHRAYLEPYSSGSKGR